METPLQHHKDEMANRLELVTILVLVETPLQLQSEIDKKEREKRHNPCFSGNSFATKLPISCGRNE